jgi:hypothetical protein
VDEEGVYSLVIWLETPGGHTLFLNGKKLGESYVCWKGIWRILELVFWWGKMMNVGCGQKEKR